ncbi:hypothetical protein PR002_g22902 [Phytophthora rubi]|uniref:Uncharacterized protein n=1 Tax=Phytophthora rubi TaxID=129364 RepID=A0A6A3IWW5_9STRA|nr:hypothetical protein PR002_g22902 [Phytophthora rubi]
MMMPHEIAANKQSYIDMLFLRLLPAVMLQFQPPNFPDTNASDTGLFHAIQTLQQKKVARSLPELICVIHEAYWELPP